MNRRDRIATQVRDSVKHVRRLSSDAMWRSVADDLPSDLLHDDKQFRLPEFRVLAFKHETRSRAQTRVLRERSLAHGSGS